VHPDADALWAALKEDRTLDGKDASGKKGGAKAGASPSASDSGDVSGKGASGEVSGEGVSVSVYNGTATPGLAADAAAALTGRGFTVPATGNAADRARSTTTITYGPGEKAHASAVARLFPDAELTAGTAPGIGVVLGADYRPGSAASPTPTPTTVPSGVADTARSADQDICSHLSYG
jgi:hypothetical protein